MQTQTNKQTNSMLQAAIGESICVFGERVVRRVLLGEGWEKKVEADR